MIIAAQYSFKNGLKEITKHYPLLLEEIKTCIRNINAEVSKTKLSKEKTMPGKTLYSPVKLNDSFKDEFLPKGWMNKKVKCDYQKTHYLENYEIRSNIRGAYRDMDFVKERIGVEVQFGKYSFMVYNVCAKMTIFHNLNLIDYGIEIVPVKSLSAEMSTGVSYFEQFV